MRQRAILHESVHVRSGGLEVTGAAETLTVPASYQVATESLPPSSPVHSYPVASQLADKVRAMYERHGATPPGRASTRDNLGDVGEALRIAGLLLDPILGGDPATAAGM